MSAFRTPFTTCFSLLLAGGAGMLSLSAHGDDASDGVRGPLITISLNTDIRGTNPGVGRDANTDAVMHQIVESLVGYAEDLSIKPVVAESYAVRDDGRTYVFTLREGLKFHNGAPVTSAEVKWSWGRYLDPATQWKCTSWFREGDDSSSGEASVVTAIDTPDPLTVVFHLARPSTLFLDRMANVQCISAILHPESVDAEGNWVKPIGTGPYALETWKHGEYIELQRFDGYLPRSGAEDGLSGRKLALAERVRFVVSPDAAATKAALLGNQIDIFHNVPLSSLEDYRNSPHTVLDQSPTLSWSALLLQTRDPLLKDVRIRRAIAMAINRKQIAEYNTYGFASVNSSAIPVGVASHTAEQDKWYAYDPQKSRALLREAGYHGQPVHIQTNRKYPNMYSNSIVIQAMLQAIGMNAQIDVLDWASQLSNYFAGKFQLSAFSFSALANPALRYYKLIGSKDVRPVYQWEDPRAMDLLQKALNTYDTAQRQEIYTELHELMIEDVPIIGLYNAHTATAMQDSVRGYRAWPLNLPRLWGVWKSDWKQSP